MSVINMTIKRLPPELEYDELERRYVVLLLDCPHTRGPAVIITEERLASGAASVLIQDAATSMCAICEPPL